MPLLECTEQKDHILIRDLWKIGTDIVHDIHVVNIDSNIHLVKTPEKCQQEAEPAKKKIYLEACLQKCRHFSPFIASVNWLLGVEAMDTLKSISSCLTTKWQQPYSRTYGYVKIRVAINFVRSTHWCIRGFRLLANKISVQQPQWEDGARINLFR